MKVIIKKSVRRAARHTWKEICQRMVLSTRPWNGVNSKPKGLRP